MKSTNQKLLCGVGTNNADYPVKPRNNKQCPYHRVWSNMISRCYSDSYRARFSAYIGCSVVDDWLTFSNFKTWMEQQDWEGKQLDKDLLKEGNKVYGPDTCVFITRQLNTFLTGGSSNSEGRGSGVSMSTNGKFITQVGAGSTRTSYVGTFDTEELAIKAYYQRRYELAVEYAIVHSDPRVSSELLRRYAL